MEMEMKNQINEVELKENGGMGEKRERKGIEESGM